MYDADTIESINCEQLATVTDRLLLRGCRVSKRRPGFPSPVQFPRGSHLVIPPTAIQPAPRIQPTTVVRAAQATRAQVFAVTVVIPTLVGIAVGLAAML